MSDIIFDITAIQPFVAQVSGPKVVSGTAGTYTAITTFPTSTIVINLDGYDGSTLSTPDALVFDPQAVVIPPGIEGEPSDPYICCEVRNNCGSNITVAIANNAIFFAAPQALSDGETAYFLIQNPVTDTSFTTVPCPSINQLYGLSDNRLQSIDETTGTYTIVPPNNVANVGPLALAFDCDNSTLYGAGNTNLYRVNLATNFWTEVGPTGAPNVIVDITYDSNSGTLFGHDTSSGLRTIDTATGASTPYGTSGITASTFGGLCYNCRNNQLYGTAYTPGNSFYSISTIDGSYNFINTLGVQIVFLEYDSVNDIFYGTSISDDGIYTLDYNGNVSFLHIVSNPRGLVLVRSKCCICVAAGTEVKCKNGSVLIENLTSGCFVEDNCGHLVEIIDVVENHKKSRDFVCISKHAFGKNKPNKEILIKRGHPLLIRNREIPCEELVDGKMVKEIRTEAARKIYTIVTERRSFINMNNMNVGTWSENDFENFRRENPNFHFNLKKK